MSEKRHTDISRRSEIFASADFVPYHRRCLQQAIYRKSALANILDVTACGCEYTTSGNTVPDSSLTD